MNNGSKPRDRKILLEKFSFVRWIEMGYNAGFARANNKGIVESKGEVVLLLNPDTIVLEDAIYKCFSRFQQTKYIACAAQLLNPDGSPQITGNFFMKGGLNHLLPLPYLGRLLRNLAVGAGVKKTNVLHAKELQEVDWITGAFLMVKKEAIKKAGLMDEDFFLYSEETEWCYRLGKQGKLCVFGDIKIMHLQGEVINNETSSFDKGYQNVFGRKGRQLMISQHLRIRKQYGAGWFIFHLLLFSVEIPIYFVCGAFEATVTTKSWSNFIEKFGGYCSNVLYLLKLTPRILANKPFFYKAL